MASKATSRLWPGRHLPSNPLVAGYRKDPETGLYLARYRNYHPTLGSWIERDPVGYDGGSDLYQYVLSNSLRYTDSWGLGEQEPDYFRAGKKVNDDWWRTHDAPSIEDQIKAFASGLPSDLSEGTPHVYHPKVRDRIEKMWEDLQRYPDTPTAGSKARMIKSLLDLETQDFNRDLHNEQLCATIGMLKAIVDLGGGAATAHTLSVLNSLPVPDAPKPPSPGAGKPRPGSEAELGSGETTFGKRSLGAAEAPKPPRPPYPEAAKPYKEMIEESFLGKVPLKKIPKKIRELAADFYEKMSKWVGGSRAEEAEKLNQDRARFLREGGTPPGDLRRK